MKKHGIKIEIVNNQDRLPLDEKKIIRILSVLLEKEGMLAARLEIALVDDPTIHQLNVEFLNHDYATDVLAFDMDSRLNHHYLEGNVIISTDTAADRAQEFNMVPENEAILYIIHGTLHLLGYDDHDSENAPIMRAKEKEYMELSYSDNINNSETGI